MNIRSVGKTPENCLTVCYNYSTRKVVAGFEATAEIDDFLPIVPKNFVDPIGEMQMEHPCH
jgi:hypothetical protein